MSPQPPSPRDSFEAGKLPNADGHLSLSPSFVAALAEQVAAAVLAGQEAPPEPWLNVEQAAEYLAAKPHRIHDLVREGRLHPHRDGRRLLFRREDLDAALTPPTEAP